MASVVLLFAPVDKGGSQLRDSRGLSPHSLLIAQLLSRVFKVGALRTVASAKLKNNIEKIKKYSEILDIACARVRFLVAFSKKTREMQISLSFSLIIQTFVVNLWRY
jgi:hypothetical protein